MSNTFGEYFRVTTWGESHGPGIGAVIDGVPAGLSIDPSRIAAELARRRPGGPLASPRKERDEPRILSGVFEGKSLGAPIAIWIPSEDARSGDYDKFEKIYRPGHADFTTEARYGIRDHRGGGRSSARETAARVAAAAIAREILLEQGIEILGWVSAVNDIDVEVDEEDVSLELVEASIVRCPCPETSTRIEGRIAAARDEGDSLGGTISVVARNVPAGLGDPMFGKIEALLALGMMSIPAAVGFEMGDGFESTFRTGSQNNDEFVSTDGTVRTITNHAGGVTGGISNGNTVRATVAFKPTSTIAHRQSTVDRDGKPVEFEGTGRHDPCVLPRAVPIVEAMMALVLADRVLARRATPPTK